MVNDTKNKWETDSNDLESIDDSNSDSDSNSEIDYNLNITLKPSSELYVIAKNGIPVGYVNDIDKAQNNMWALARLYKAGWCLNYNTYIKETDENIIQVVGVHKFLIFSYETMFSTFEFYSVKEIVDKKTSTKDDETCTKDDETCTKDDEKEIICSKYRFF